MSFSKIHLRPQSTGNIQEAVAPPPHNRKIVYWDVERNDARGILSGSYPLLNKNNIIWSILVISADNARLRVNI